MRSGRGLVTGRVEEVFPVVGSGESEEGSVKLETHHRGVSFKEVLTRDMRESSSDDTSLILDDVFVGISFDGENPSTTDRPTIRGRNFERASRHSSWRYSLREPRAKMLLWPLL